MSTVKRTVILGVALASIAAAMSPVFAQPRRETSQGVELAPMLSWINGTGATSRNVYVYRGNQVMNGMLAFENIDVQGNSVSLALGTLVPGETYLWFTTAINDIGFAYSEQRTFTTEPPCLGDADFNKTVDFADINAVLANWLNDYGLGTGLGDSNFDGFVNFDDITVTLANWLQVCP